MACTIYRRAGIRERGTYVLVAADQVLHVVDRGVGQRRQVAVDLDRQEAVALALALEARSEFRGTDRGRQVYGGLVGIHLFLIGAFA